MKLKPNMLLLVVVSLAYWAGLANASAFYDPGAQRWLNRDPIGERGGAYLYAYVGNNPVSVVDLFGLYGNVV